LKVPIPPEAFEHEALVDVFEQTWPKVTMQSIAPIDAVTSKLLDFQSSPFAS